MAPQIMRDAEVHFVFDTGIVDISCDTVAFEITPSTEEIDVGTFCNPSATDQGRVTFTASVSMLWSVALYNKLLPHVGKTGTFASTLSTAPGSFDKFIRFNCRYSAMPWGRFEIGQRVEVELPLAVLDTPQYVDA
jgi:hypothetical protein